MFGLVDVENSIGSLLAHKVSAGDHSLKKGHRLSKEDASDLARIGLAQVLVRSLEEGDMAEDEAADHISSGINGKNIHRSNATTGRVNFHATEDGLFIANRTTIDTLNSIDQSITFACLADRVPVKRGDLVATLKIIPLAIEKQTAEFARSLASSMPTISVMEFRSHTVSLIATTLPGLSPKTLDKTARVLGQRLIDRKCTLLSETRIGHSLIQLSAALGRQVAQFQGRTHFVVIFGASAVSDFDDVIPSAIRFAGGEVDRVGMPVDPGNLLVIGKIGQLLVIGAPGCARSPAENGFDWVLDRVAAGDKFDALELSRMGVGGLLKEIHSRPRIRLADGNPVQADSQTDITRVSA
jgi:molybdenum cofactor cytidylyltransferase